MAIGIADNFDYGGGKPNFDRDQFKTNEEMLAYPSNFLDEGHISYCVEDKKHYKWDGTEWVEFNTGSGDSLLEESGINSAILYNTIGCSANGTNSLAGGINSIANGNYALAYGRFNESNGRGSIALGGVTQGYNFTGAANATTYTTTIPERYLDHIVGIHVYKTTTNEEIPATIVSATKGTTGLTVTLDRSLSETAVSGVKWYLLLNVATGSSAIAMGGLAKGGNSLCIGLHNISSSTGSVALGHTNTSEGTQAFCVGYGNIAKDVASISMGYTNKAVGGQAIAMGYLNEATAGVAIAMGNKNTVKGQSSIGIGVLNDCIASSSVAIGYKNKSHNHGTVVLGGYTTATNQGEVALGIGNVSHTGTRFSIGGGNELMNYDATTNKNLLEVMDNGDIWIGNYSTGKQLWNAATGTSPLIEEIVTNLLNK